VPSCEIDALNPDHYNVRPIGGNRVIEASVEARLWVSDRMQLAAFADYGRLSGRESSVETGTDTGSLLAPGVGLRVLTNLGPIRLDIGYDGRGARTYPVFQEISNRDVVRIGTVRFDPFTWDGASGLREFTRRLQLHIAIGQAF
jgi:outer membrane translocation and assembly module TamA